MNESRITPMPAVEAVIPHRGGALLIDRIVAMDGQRLEASLVVRRGTAFSDAHDELPGWVAPEIMAQAVAAFGGCRSLQQRGPAPLIGLLLGVRQLTLASKVFRPGEHVRVEVLCTSSDEEGRGVFDCTLHTSAGLAAAATLTAFQPPDPAAIQVVLAQG